jgi:hypothetical protein
VNIEIFNKILFFWFIFFVTPGPVWLAVMATTNQQAAKDIVKFFFTVFLSVNLIIQVPQAIVSVVFVDIITQLFSAAGYVFYFLGGAYILFMAAKSFKAGWTDSPLQLSFVNLLMIMLLSPKIWILFPSGAVIANQLNLGLMVNAGIYAFIMFSVSSILFYFYVLIGKIGQKLLKDNFSYLVTFLLGIFAMFLFIQGFKLIL